MGIAVAFFTFTLAAVGGYMVNDVKDVERDRWHPVKRLRPLPSGTVGIRTATTMGACCLVAGPLTAFGLGYNRLALVVGIYGLFATRYSLGLKHLPMLEIGIVASGFVFRALAGVAATGVPASRWFLVVVCAGAVMVAVGKRSAELSLVDAAAHHRSSLHAYSARGLSAARLVGCGHSGRLLPRVGRHPTGRSNTCGRSVRSGGRGRCGTVPGPGRAGRSWRTGTPCDLRSAAAAGHSGVAGRAAGRTGSCLGRRVKQLRPHIRFA